MIGAANDLLRGSLGVGVDPASSEVAAAMRPSLDAIVTRITRLAADQLSEVALATKEAELRERFEHLLNGDDWLTYFRGRDVLKRFTAEHVSNVPYEALRDLILARMKDAGYRPPGMAAVLHAIADDRFP
jgi:hypothetical protein